ncbi:nitrogenase iron-molybdenum cofactor biosynthesis protein NifN [Gorillibacterium timonense]|uniref:nitrogenase iron-molybdenum cofactor biosynthesis protein NifN n=1 Tax=Gorillibacterium timonense TaxID=1689269 RepID=UPI0011DD7737|nr:nitrogenase iron-molybdenum cofactor biosynthesis protein NifN [Gorillibacterium timonense]
MIRNEPECPLQEEGARQRKPLTVNPIQVSPSLGAVLAMQGFYRGIPILHGAEGCAESIKTMLMNHFREPITLQGIAMHEYNHVFGSGDSIQEAFDLAITHHKPDVIGLIGTTLTDMVGEDLQRNLQSLRKVNQAYLRNRIVFQVQASDEEGWMETGYAQVTEAVIDGIIELNKQIVRKKQRNRINLLPGPHLTPGDVIELKEIIASFDLEVLTLPDLSLSLPGHLLMGHSALTRGGTPIEHLKEVPSSGFTIAIGSCMENAARRMETAFRIPYQVFPGVTGLKATDDFFSFLQSYGRGAAPPLKYRWQREFLLDGMLDACSVYRDKKVVGALEPDHAAVMQGWLKEMGVSSFCCVVPDHSRNLNPSGSLQMGDLEELDRIAADGADLWLSSSRGEWWAKNRGIPFYPIGFPVLRRLGYPLTSNVGYKGTLDLIHRIGNRLLMER